MPRPTNYFLQATPMCCAVKPIPEMMMTMMTCDNTAGECDDYSCVLKCKM